MMAKNKDNSLVDVLSKETIPTKTIKSPLLDGAEVTFYTDVTGDFLQEMENKREKEGDTEVGFWSAAECIADWNFSDKEGKKLDVTVENIKKLSLKLQRWLLSTSQKLVLEDTEKKESPANSSKR